MNADLTGQHAVVTGAAQGLGFACASILARNGAAVTMLDVQAEKITAAAAEVAAEVGPGARVLGHVCDVRSRPGVEDALAAGRAAFGPVDLVASIAGTAWHASLVAMRDEDLDEMLDVHVRGAFNLLRGVVAEWTTRRRGKFVVVTSPAAVRGQVNGSAYSAAKAALHGLVKSAALELGPYGIQVNAVLPMAATPMTAEARTDEARNASYLANVPLGRWGNPDEIAQTFLYLASSAGDYVTGIVLPVDGGRTI